MPLSEDGLDDVRRRTMIMLFDTHETIRLFREHADALFGDHSAEVAAAIDEYMHDFFESTHESGETHPEALIYKTSRQSFQRAGLYGAQLTLKERQVTEINKEVRDSLTQAAPYGFRAAFNKWIDRINNFLGSLASASGVAEALKELKDCLRDELPDDDA